MEQIVRDARIGQIYEGTNGIQALDLVGRKVLRDGGRTLFELLDEIRETTVDDEFVSELDQACDRLEATTRSLLRRAQEQANLPGAVSTDYLELVGMTLCAWMWARMATLAPADDFGTVKRETARFYFARLLPRTLGLERSIMADASVVMDMPEALFTA